MSEPTVILSFEVVRYVEYQVSGTAVCDTVLRSYVDDSELRLRGRHWKLGEKVDFREMKADE